jgi:LysM repeat protein
MPDSSDVLGSQRRKSMKLTRFLLVCFAAGVLWILTCAAAPFPQQGWTPIVRSTPPPPDSPLTEGFKKRPDWWGQFAGEIKKLAKSKYKSLEEFREVYEQSFYWGWEDEISLHHKLNELDYKRVIGFSYGDDGLEELLKGNPKDRLDHHVLGVIAYALNCTEDDCLDMYRNFVSARPDVILPGETKEGAAKRLYWEHFQLIGRPPQTVRNGNPTTPPPAPAADSNSSAQPTPTPQQNSQLSLSTHSDIVSADIGTELLQPTMTPASPAPAASLPSPDTNSVVSKDDVQSPLAQSDEAEPLPSTNSQTSLQDPAQTTLDAPLQGTETPQNSLSTTYIVKRGDRLWLIAEHFYGDGHEWHRIAEANHITDPTHIYPGQKLNIPPSIFEALMVAPPKAALPLLLLPAFPSIPLVLPFVEDMEEPIPLPNNDTLDCSYLRVGCATEDEDRQLNRITADAFEEAPDQQLVQPNYGGSVSLNTTPFGGGGINIIAPVFESPLFESPLRLPLAFP